MTNIQLACANKLLNYTDSNRNKKGEKEEKPIINEKWEKVLSKLTTYKINLSSIEKQTLISNTKIEKALHITLALEE